MAERQILGDPIRIGVIHLFTGAQAAAALGVFRGQQMSFAGARAHHFAGAGYLEPLGHRFPSLDTFGASHKILFLYKRAGTIDGPQIAIKGYFELFWWNEVE